MSAGLPEAEIALLRAMLARAGEAGLVDRGLIDGMLLDRVEASLRDGADGASRWQKLVASGVPAPAARALRERWRNEGALAAALERGLAGRPALERALGWHLLRTGAIEPATLTLAIDKAAAAALGRRKIGIQQLLVEAGQLTPARLCAAIAEAGQSILVCADCGRSNWQEWVDPGTMLLCEGCQGRLGAARGEPTAELACPVGYDSLDAPVAALLREGIAYGEPLTTDTSGALHEAIGHPGRLTKRLSGRATAEDLRDLRKAANAARRLECPVLVAPSSVVAAEDGAFLDYELPAGHLLSSFGGTLRESEALAIARDLGRALAALHRAELTHGALRPAAVWLADTGNALLLFAGEALQPGLDPSAVPGDRYRGGRTGREGDLHALGALLVSAQAGEVPAGPESPELAAIPPRSAELARRCMGGAPAFSHAGDLAAELAATATEVRARSLLTELSTTLGDRASRASSSATTVRRPGSSNTLNRRTREEPGSEPVERSRGGAKADANRAGTSRRPSDGTPAVAAGGGLGRHRASTPHGIGRRPARVLPLRVVIVGVGALAAAVAITLMLTRPGASAPVPVVGPPPTPPATPIARPSISEEDRERLAVMLGRRELREAKALAQRLAPEGEAQARLVVEALLLVQPLALLALTDASEWPELSTAAATVAAQPGFRDTLRSEAERSLASGSIAVAQRLAGEAIRESGARETWLLKVLGELDLDQLARLRTESAKLTWTELDRAIAARMASPEHRALVVTRAGELVGVGSLEAAELALLAATSSEQVSEAIWDEVVRPLAPDALSRAIDAASAQRRWDRLARRAGRELAVRLPELAAARAKEAMLAAIDLDDADRHAEVVVRLSAYVALRPDDYKGYGMRGNAYRLSGFEDLALADYQRTLELRPGDSIALNNRAIILRDRGRVDEALADQDEAAKHVGDDEHLRASVLLNRAITLYLASRLDRADADIAELLRHFDTAPPEAKERLRPQLDFLEAISALIAAARGDEAGGAARLAPLLDRHPGRLLGAAGPIKVASELARRISALLPAHPLPHVERHAVLAYFGQRAEAIAALEAARDLAIGPYANRREAIEIALERARREPPKNGG